MTVLAAQVGQTDIRFDARSAEAAIRELQEIGRAALDATLTATAPVYPAAFPGLNAWLWVGSTRSAVKAHGLRAARDRFPFSPPEAVSPLETALLSGAVPTRRVDLAIDRLRDLWRRLRRRQAEGRAPRGGEGLAEALIATAYGDPEFRLAVARALRRALRERVLFGANGPPVAVLAPATVAALVVTCGMPKSLPASVADALRKAAARMLGASRWAGFWDLWMAHEAVRASAAAPLPDMLELAGFAARLTEAGGAADDGDPETAVEVPEQLRSDWNDAAPGFAEALWNKTI